MQEVGTPASYSRPVSPEGGREQSSLAVLTVNHLQNEE